MLKSGVTRVGTTGPGSLCFICYAWVLFFLFASVLCASEIEQKLADMRFNTEAHDWRAERYCRAYLKAGAMTIESESGEPTLSRQFDAVGGRFRMAFRIRTLVKSDLSVYWTTRGSPRRSEEAKQTQTLIHDGQWHDYHFNVHVPDYLTSISLRFGSAEGVWEIESFQVFRKRAHPLRIQNIAPHRYEADGKTYDMLRYTVLNDAPVPLTFRVGNQIDEIVLQGRQTVELLAPLKLKGNLAVANVPLRPEEFSEIDYPVFRYVPEGETDWIVRPLGDGKRTIEIASDARMARIRRGDEIVALIAPLVHRNGKIPDFDAVSINKSLRTSTTNGGATKNFGEILRFEDPAVLLEILIADDSLRFSIHDKTVPIENKNKSPTNHQPPTTTLPTAPLPPTGALLEGPVVRVFGTLQSGLLPGVEFLGVGDVSSSEIDLEPPYNQRSRPNPGWVTMPLAVIATDKEAVMLRWRNEPLQSTLQPTYSSPNGFDRTEDHRMSLIGTKIETTLEFLPSKFFDASDSNSKIDEAAAIRFLRRYVEQEGFPEPPPAPRSSEDQHQLSLTALEGPLMAPDGVRWGYAAEERWPRRPFADMLSTMARLTGRPMKASSIVSGGADISNDAIYFLTEKVEQWKHSREQSIRGILALVGPDGSFQFRTRFPEVESATTSFGYTAVRALEIMEFVRLIGNEELFENVRLSLEYLKKCKVPRGGFYRDSPLHTPDLLTAASLTWLYAWAFEYSGEARYLELARRYAFCGVPFVYQWSDREAMLYMTVPKYGGTDRNLPFWFGTSQTRVGLLYAYALGILAQHDSSVDWHKMARGILHATEIVQYPDGPEAGCVPETYDILGAQPLGWRVNPCALVSLRLMLDGQIDSLSVTVDGRERYVSPYPLHMGPKGIEAVGAERGRKFQILRNGGRVVTVDGSGPFLVD